MGKLKSYDDDDESDLDNCQIIADIRYEATSISLDPSTMNLTVVVTHSVTTPLYLNVSNPVATLLGISLPVSSCTTEPFMCDSSCGEECEQITTFTINLPTSETCTEETVDLSFDFMGACQSGNNNCQGILAGLMSQSSTASLQVNYNYCPVSEQTTFRVSSYQLTQGGVLVSEGEIVSSLLPLYGNITLAQVSQVPGSVFSSAIITDLRVLEVYPSASPPPCLLITPDVTLPTATFLSGVIQVCFEYNIQLENLTDTLLNYQRGIYIQATIEIIFAPPGARRNNNKKQFVRLQVSSHSPSTVIAPSSFFLLPPPPPTATLDSIHAPKKVQAKMQKFAQKHATLVQTQNSALMVVVMSLSVTFIAVVSIVAFAVYTVLQNKSAEKGSTPVVVNF